MPVPKRKRNVGTHRSLPPQSPTGHRKAGQVKPARPGRIVYWREASLHCRTVTGNWGGTSGGLGGETGKPQLTGEWRRGWRPPSSSPACAPLPRKVPIPHGGCGQCLAGQSDALPARRSGWPWTCCLPVPSVGSEERVPWEAGGSQPSWS